MRKLEQCNDDPRLEELVKSELKLKHLARSERDITRPKKTGRITN